jgi:hypothetical protein
VKTNDQGRAIFERLSSGRYRVWTRLAEKCGNVEPTMSRVVAPGNSGTANLRMVIGGRAVFRIATALGPVTGRSVAVTPDPVPPSTLVNVLGSSGRRLPIVTNAPRSCSGLTDSDGRVVIKPVPPGPAQIRVVLFNSSYIARVNVPEGGREMVIAVPDGLIPVKVIDQISRQPVVAMLNWVGGGGRVETLTTPNGDALLEGVGTAGGTLTISARDYQTVEGSFTETPDTMQEVPLMKLPSTLLTVRVVNSENESIGGAVVELLARGPADVAEFAAADAKGVVTFSNVPPGSLQFIAHADGFAPITVQVNEESRGSITMTLTRARGR